MSECPVIVQVFLDSDAPDAICPPTWYGESRGSEAKDYKGLPYWQAPDGKGAVYRWSFDMVTCGDERWVVFGPFEDKGEALLRMHSTFPHDWLLGYRVINEHCAKHCGALGRVNKFGVHRTFEFYREAWTDG